MLINGKAMMACSALVDKLISNGEGTITLAPLSKFPVVRDLAVDRSVLFENLKKVKAWVPVDGSYDPGRGAEAVSADAGATLSSVELHLVHDLHGGLPAVQRGHRLCGRGGRSRRPSCSTWTPQAAVLKEERLRALAGDGGVQECGFAQNCVQACPKQLPADGGDLGHGARCVLCSR